ncbi:MAG: hypothetical protein COA43_09480 [Robiginitomaculum sp.]|nr:MAG: hypothetical protein COA43_09480 [Robiginitomaculum sp.]
MAHALLFRYILQILSLSTICAWSLSAGATVRDKNDTGVYREITVSSLKECEALCKADSKCRGSITEQADTRYPVMQCKLNNGFGKNSPFPNIPPTPFNINIALADFNTYRATKGLKPVILNDKLNAASEVHARDLAAHGIISHTGTDGSAHADRVKRQGYKFSLVAENVATGQKSWEEVFKAWQDSPGHDENLLLEDVTDFGIAIVYDPTTRFQTYWAMLVATPFDAGKYGTYSYIDAAPHK